MDHEEIPWMGETERTLGDALIKDSFRDVRFSLDDVIRMYGFTREEIKAEADDD